MARTFLLWGSLFGFSGVTAGAFGAHVLRSRFSPAMLDVFEVAVRYQLIHALALLLVGLLLTSKASPSLRCAGWSFVAGVWIFSGSLYLLTFTGQRWLGVMTPIGGTALLVGWLCIAAAFWTGNANRD